MPQCPFHMLRRCESLKFSSLVSRTYANIHSHSDLIVILHLEWTHVKGYIMWMTPETQHTGTRKNNNNKTKHDSNQDMQE